MLKINAKIVGLGRMEVTVAEEDIVICFYILASDINQQVISISSGCKWREVILHLAHILRFLSLICSLS